MFEAPMMDAATASYDDVDPFLNIMIATMCAIENFKLVMVVGDGQSYSRMVWLKINRPDIFKWLIPLPGEFHFIVHVLMAIHILWYAPLICFFTLEQNRSRI